MWDNGYAVLDFYFYFGVTIYLCSIVKQIVEVWGNIRNFVKKIYIKGNVRLSFCRNFMELREKFVDKNVQCGNFRGYILKKNCALCATVKYNSSKTRCIKVDPGKQKKFTSHQA